MNKALKITLELNRKECIRGESVLFTIVIQNDTNEPIADFPIPSYELETVFIMADGPKGKRKGGPKSREKRDGEHRHGPRTPMPTMTLAPKQKVEVRDDLLCWLGELEPGDYSLTAEHAMLAVSEPVKLKVLAARPALNAVARNANEGPGVMRIATWGHKQPDGVLLFHQQQSPALPRNIVHSFRGTVVPEGTRVEPAIFGNSDVATGHLVWIEKEATAQIVSVGRDDGKLAQLPPVKLPTRGETLRSPMSAVGSLWLPIVSKDRDKVVFLQVSSDGSTLPVELALGADRKLGAYQCFWDSARRLNFFFAAERGRELQLARLALDDPKSGLVTRSLHVADDPLVWIEAYIDVNAPARDAPYFEEDIPPEDADKPMPLPEPPLIAVCVTQSATALNVTRYNTVDGQHKAFAALPVHQLRDPRVLSGVITWEFDVVLLLADADKTLYLASTTTNTVKPLSECMSTPVTPENEPALVAASRQGRSPWVHLRYIDKENVQYQKLEPAEEQDPYERRKQTLAARR